jgi:hypothetical protein
MSRKIKALVPILGLLAAAACMDATGPTAPQFDAAVEEADGQAQQSDRSRGTQKNANDQQKLDAQDR